MLSGDGAISSSTVIRNHHSDLQSVKVLRVRSRNVCSTSLVAILAKSSTWWSVDSNPGFHAIAAFWPTVTPGHCRIAPGFTSANSNSHDALRCGPLGLIGSAHEAKGRDAEDREAVQTLLTPAVTSDT